ncbi:hypothetical protein V2J09_009830, partial [Rumex salicifolius]
KWRLDEAKSADAFLERAERQLRRENDNNQTRPIRRLLAESVNITNLTTLKNPAIEKQQKITMGTDGNGIRAPPPPFPPPTSYQQKRFVINKSSKETRQSVTSTAAREMWENLFDDAYRADVVVHTECGGQIYAHASILGMASPVMKNMMKQSKKHKDRRRSITIRGVPHDAVRVFIRFLYDQAEMEEFVLPLLVLSHAFIVPHLKRECERRIEIGGMLNSDNVIDIFQLALLCDASRLSLICHRLIVRNFKAVIVSDGWNAMKEAHPLLEKLIFSSVAEAELTQKMMTKKINERKMYAQLYEAMEALVHICKDGCRTIGPHDKVFRADQGPCGFEACKGLELLVRHFAACKLRVPGGCMHCKRMWQLFELHSRLCVDSNACRVPLCRKFKGKKMKQNKKEEMKWRTLAKKIVWSKSITGAPNFCLVPRST